MTRPVMHDPDDGACRCHHCCQARALEEQSARERAALDRETAALIAQAEAEYQLRLPMAPLPHCAGQPRTLARAHARHLLPSASEPS